MSSNATFVLSVAEIGTLAFVNIMFSGFGSLGNILVCLVFIGYRGFRSTMNTLIVSLACSDLLVCLLAQPMFVASLVNNYQQESAGNVFEGVRKRLTWISLLASAGNLLGVTLDRYVAVSRPLSYPALVTAARTRVLIAVLWSLALGLGSATESRRGLKMVGQIYVLALLVCVIFPLYVRVLCIARRHARVIQSACMSHSAATTTGFEEDNESAAARAAFRSNVRRADRNSLKTVGIISAIFFLGWFPILFIPFLYRARAFSEVLVVFQWANTLALCSSACNPFVYSWRDRRFRKTLATIYSRWMAKRVAPMETDRTASSSLTNEELKPARFFLTTYAVMIQDELVCS